MKLKLARCGLNRIIYPGVPMEQFFALTRDMGLHTVELRNDLPGGQILDGLTPEAVKALAETHGIRIATINAVQHFNLGSMLDAVYADAQNMVATAAAIGCQAVVLCPHNDVNDGRTADQCYQETVAALQKLAPLFQDSGIVGLVEPLGFEECSLRSKETAIKAIQESGYAGYKLVHDTFHHYLGPDDGVFPDYTGLVHISGVETTIPAAQIRDEHRILIGAQDMMKNMAQIQALESQGYTGLYCFEPFSSAVQSLGLDDFRSALSESLHFITA